MSRRNGVLLADRSQASRDRIKYLLELDPLFEVAAETDSGGEAVSLAGTIKPALALVAMELQDMKGSLAVREIKKTNPDILVVMLAGAADVETYFEALKSGAQGCVLKTLHPASFHEYLRSLLIEDAPLPRELGCQILKPFVLESVPRPVQPSLSAMETAVLRYLCRGFKNDEIAHRMAVPENTIKLVLKDIFFKLRLKNRVQLVRYALENGIFTPKPVARKVKQR
ncbi:response regulator transcription factor [Cohnella sp. GbtcB17]|uniref:response regulator n=1 Tax=Cohnella sp. GbtcB17 TaxID=2824762 RepID=UPI001C306BE9